MSVFYLRNSHRGMEWGGRREEGSGWGTHVYLWRIRFNIWQNQYNIVKLKKKKERNLSRNLLEYPVKVLSHYRCHSPILQLRFGLCPLKFLLKEQRSSPFKDLKIISILEQVVSLVTSYFDFFNRG